MYCIQGNSVLYREELCDVKRETACCIERD